MSTALITLLAPIISDIVKRVAPDRDQAANIEREVKLTLLDKEEALQNMAGKIVLAEAQSGNWLTASWRPLLMLTVVAIIACNYLLFPIIGIFYPAMITLALPAELWNLLTIGVGGYVVGRSGEKMVNSYTQGGQK